MIRKYLFYLFITFLLVTACNEDDSPIDTNKEYNKFAQLKEDDSLLKKIKQKTGFYIFEFETDTLTIPENEVLSVETDIEHWNTKLTLINQTSIEIPTLGTSMDSFINNVKVNPSGFNPLTARIRLSLPCGGRIHASIIPKEGCKTPALEHLFNYTHETTQLIDILGLYADYINKIELTFTDKSGNPRATTTVEVKTVAIETRGFNSFNVITAKVDKMEPGLNLVNSPGEGETDTSVPYMVDADGEIRWILLLEKSEIDHIGAQCGLHRMKNGNFITGDANFHRLVELDLLGNVINIWDLKAWGYSFHHEVFEDKNGNIIAIVTNNNAKLSDNETTRIFDHAIEINPETSTITKVWDFTSILDQTRILRVDKDLPLYAYFGQNEANWLHNNGLTEIGDDLLATGRWQGVFKYTREGQLKWIIAPHNDWKDSYKQYLLTPLDKNNQPITDLDVLNGKKSHPDFEWCWGVHCPVAMPNGHVLAFDNGYCRNYVPQLTNASGQYSRIVEYEIDEKNKTIRQVFQYGRERTDCFAYAISGVQYLGETDHRLFCPGMNNLLSDGTYGARIVEIDPKTEEVVFELEIKGGTFHRANRISLYPEGL
ncbi:MAG: aryl-sulfate sulfotransferase [Parabacteroides sp.]|nr:aryl-sulfate sulfotransferase [Parabacteroides sp.]